MRHFALAPERRYVLAAVDVLGADVSVLVQLSGVHYSAQRMMQISLAFAFFTRHLVSCRAAWIDDASSTLLQKVSSSGPALACARVFRSLQLFLVSAQNTRFTKTF